MNIYYHKLLLTALHGVTFVVNLRQWQLYRCMTFADCRLQTADCRPQIADCKLKDTKNLPNKGDTIKTITSS